MQNSVLQHRILIPPLTDILHYGTTCVIRYLDTLVRPWYCAPRTPTLVGHLVSCTFTGRRRSTQRYLLSVGTIVDRRPIIRDSCIIIIEQVVNNTTFGMRARIDGQGVEIVLCFRFECSQQHTLAWRTTPLLPPIHLGRNP